MLFSSMRHDRATSVALAPTLHPSCMLLLRSPCSDPAKYLSALLLSLSTMLHLELPQVGWECWVLVHTRVALRRVCKCCRAGGQVLLAPDDQPAVADEHRSTCCP